MILVESFYRNFRARAVILTILAFCVVLQASMLKAHAELPTGEISLEVSAIHSDTSGHSHFKAMNLSLDKEHAGHRPYGKDSAPCSGICCLGACQGLVTVFNEANKGIIPETVFSERDFSRLAGVPGTPDYRPPEA